MDKELKGEIVCLLDDMIKDLDCKNIRDWLLQDEAYSVLFDMGFRQPSVIDIVLGYVIGYMVRVAHGKVFEYNEREKIKEFYSKVGLEGKVPKKKKIKVPGPTEEEIDEIRDLVQMRFSKIRDKVYKSLNV